MEDAVRTMGARGGSGALQGGRGRARLLQAMLLAPAAPLGWLVLRWVQGASPWEELAAAPGVYLYMLLGSLAVLAAFGARAGLAEDRLVRLGRALADECVTDALTGLRTAPYFRARLQEAFAAAVRSGAPLSVIVFDLDRFKRINDDHGHAAGDAVLAACARVLLEVTRRGETAGRIGGEEFALLLPNTGASQAARTAERVRVAVEGTRVAAPGGAQELRVTLSGGVASTADGGYDGPFSLLSAADAAMYVAKRRGRNRIAAPRVTGGAGAELPGGGALLSRAREGEGSPTPSTAPPRRPSRGAVVSLPGGRKEVPMSTKRTIVVGVANTRDTDATLVAALELAERSGAELHAVHAFEVADPMIEAYARAGYFDAQVVAAHAETVRSTFEVQVGATPGAEGVVCHTLGGNASWAINRVAEEVGADLIVVGATRHGTLARTILGTTGQRVLRSAPAPVLVLRSPLPAGFGRILLTTDLSELSARAHDAALALLDALGWAEDAELRSLLVTWFGFVVPPPLSEDAAQGIAEGELERFLEQRRAANPAHPQVSAVVRVGDAAKEIVAEAAEWSADLVVLGTHGRSGTERFFLGSVAEGALRGALCSVLLIPQRVLEGAAPVGRAEALPAGGA
jgi:diguanylate cyclase (GGDEF)-like protein